MKSIAFFALSLVATAAMATGSVNVTKINITGTSDQTASVNGGYVKNTAQQQVQRKTSAFGRGCVKTRLNMKFRGLLTITQLKKNAYRAI